MMSSCNDVTDDLADLVAGDRLAIERHAEHLASCDACRDARHEATRLADAVAGAGADHVSPPDLASRVLAALDASAQAGPVPPAASAQAVSTIEVAKAPTEAVASTDSARAPETDTRGPTPPKHPLARRRARTWLATGGMFAAAAAAIASVALFRDEDGGSAVTGSFVTARPGIGELREVSRAAPDAGGVLVRDGARGWRNLDKGTILAAGSAVKTDERTRAAIHLMDWPGRAKGLGALDQDTKLILDHATELQFSPDNERSITMSGGRLSADVAHDPQRPATIRTPQGTIEVLGTELVVTSTPSLTAVQVVRGTVALVTTSGRREQLNAGEEGVIENGALRVGVAPSMSRELGWTELEAPQADADSSIAGVGALRAYKPGEKRDRDWKLALATHDIKVRIVGPIARTEITETFRNDSDATLEGVYQFPLPADAQIDGLSLDIPDQPGAFIDGAFIAKDRAQKIWQGVIDRATPQQIARPSNEIVWVPGPWKDPALLDWKRGGRFELRVFPIPARGQRTIKLTYTQVVPTRGAERQYLYPLAHSSDGSTVAERFTVDVEVRGARQGFVRSTGYDLSPDPARSEVHAMTLAANAFVPRGDLVVDYRPTDGDAELRTWTFAGGVAVAPDEALARKRGVGIDPAVIDAQRTVASDARPTAVLALRPELTRWRETHPRDLAIVVDASQSMVGERFTRASELVAGIVQQMDRRDRVTVLACDSECRSWGALRAPVLGAPAELRAWLRTHQVAGASDVVASIREAAVALGRVDAAKPRERHVVFVGDGFSTTGFRRPADIERVLAQVAETGVRVSTIAIGGDADRSVLAAAARGGGGSYLAWVPGQPARFAALAALESTYGASLRDATVELPAGLVDVAPTVLPTIRSGEEVLIAARVTGPVTGDVIVRGKVGGHAFERKYPVDVAVSSSPGNAFVPRLWAALAIEQLERSGTEQDRLRTIGLSQAYGLMSKETSLLVLESQAMFDAFGVDRGQPAIKWTGEDSLDEHVAGADAASVAAKDAGDASDHAKAGKGDADGENMTFTTDKLANIPVPAAPTKPAPDAPRATTADKKAVATARDNRDRLREEQRQANRRMSMDLDGSSRFGGRGGMVAMRRTWVRVPSTSEYAGPSDAIRTAVASAEAALQANPDSRERHRALVQALSYAGDLDRALEIATSWLERDRIDPQALGVRADLLGRDGQRDLGLRTLAGLVDLAADRVDLHERLVRAYDATGRKAQACSHRITLAAIAPREVARAGAAVRCLRSLGRDADADLVVRAAPTDLATEVMRLAAAEPPPRPARGDLVAIARWTGGSDVDVSLVMPDGSRVSWMGGRKDAVVRDATSRDHETLALGSLKRGNYLVEVTRGDDSTSTVRGTITVDVLGTRRVFPFELTGKRVVAGRVGVRLEERLVPL